MKIYLFGNQDLKEDNLPFTVASRLKEEKDIEFINVKPNEDLPFENERYVVIMDTIWGIEKVEVISDSDLDKIVLPPRSTVHDFDLAFQLKYLKKLGKICKFTIIGLPLNHEIDYSRVQSILRKLVAQDIQGS